VRLLTRQRFVPISNDGAIGNHPGTCSASTYWYAFCILERATDVRRVTVYPLNDPDNEKWFDRLKDLQIELYADVTGITGPKRDDAYWDYPDMTFNGLLDTVSTGRTRNHASTR